MACVRFLRHRDSAELRDLFSLLLKLPFLHPAHGAFRVCEVEGYTRVLSERSVSARKNG